MTILIEISLTALSDLRRRAEEGDSNAQYELGRIFMVGLGLSQDYQQAAKWYERAAEQGFAAAQFMMGFLYEHGKGVLRTRFQTYDSNLLNRLEAGRLLFLANCQR